jgi:hypothetical protein
MLRTVNILCILCDFRNKYRLFPFTALSMVFNGDSGCILRRGSRVLGICYTKFVFQCKHLQSEFYLNKIFKYEHITASGDNI